MEKAKQERLEANGTGKARNSQTKIATQATGQARRLTSCRIGHRIKE
jgi:hypothetical protein